MSIKIKIKNSVIVMAPEGFDQLRDELSKIDLSNKTPLDCMDIIRELRDKYGKGKV